MAEKWSLGRALRGMFTRPQIDDTTWDDLETALITADFGPDITEAIVDDLREKVTRFGTMDPRRSQAHAARVARGALRRVRHDPEAHRTAGRCAGRRRQRRRQDHHASASFANFLGRYGRSIVVGAADYIPRRCCGAAPRRGRSAGERRIGPAGEGGPGPCGSVAFQTIDYAKRNGTEIVLVDTAGRLHTKAGLMDELTKVRRVIEKQAPISEVLLVLDATTGQNGVDTAGSRNFSSMPG